MLVVFALRKEKLFSVETVGCQQLTYIYILSGLGAKYIILSAGCLNYVYLIVATYCTVNHLQLYC